MKKYFKKAADGIKKAKNNKHVQDAMKKKSLWLGAAFNAGTTAYTFRKAGPKAAAAVGIGTLVWTVASQAMFKSWDIQEEKEKKDEDINKSIDNIFSNKENKVSDDEDKTKEKGRKGKGKDKKGPGPAP